ncbi:hypothetical protein BJ878DRAFT_118061 [Calycina marina]|uniref:Uncharacterized protein n=1 Tax=Calycina marina TaxID=1763456 RepID=A0A9P7Z1Z6_9HELO|nr:hypothetical protein BJ878DRAFT_118061 [Calycina marina]
MPGVKVTEMAPKRERPTIRKVAHMLRAISRMQAGVREWKKHMEVKKLLLEKIDEVRKQKAIENARAEAQQKVGVSTGSEEDFVTKKMEIRPMLTRMATGDRVEKLVKSRKFSKLTATKSQTTEVTSTLKAHKSKRQPSLLRSASISARVPRSEDEHDISEVLDAEAQLTAPTRDLEMSKIVGAERQQLSNTKENNISKDVRAQFRQAFVTDEYDVSQMLAATSSRKNNPEKEQTAPMTALSKVAQASNTVPVSTQRSEQTSSQPLVDDEDVAKVLDFAPAIQPATKTSRHHFQELKQSEKHSSLTQEKRRLLKKLVSAAASTHRASQPVDREEAQSPAKDARALHFVSQSHGADAAADTTAQSGQMMDAETQEFTQEFAFKIEALIKSGGSMGKMPRLDAFSFATQPQKRSKPSRKSAPAQSEVQHIVSSSSSMDPKIQFEIKPSHPSKHSEAQPEVQASAPTSKQPDVQPELAPSTRDSTQNDSQFQIEPATPAHTQTQPQTQTHDEIQESPQPSRRADTQAEMQTQTQTLTGIQPSEIDDTMMLDLDGNTTFIERCAAMGVRAEDLISIQTAMTEDHTVHTQPDSSPDVTIQSVQSRDQTIETQPEITTLRAETRKMRKTSEKSRGSMSTGGYSELARMIAMRKASEAGYGDGGMMSPRKLNGVVRKE